MITKLAQFFHETTHIVLVVDGGNFDCRNTCLCTDAETGRPCRKCKTGYGGCSLAGEPVLMKWN